MEKNLQKIKNFLAILLQCFYRRKKMKFFYEKTSIEICIFLRKFLPNIGLTSHGLASMFFFEMRLNDFTFFQFVFSLKKILSRIWNSFLEEEREGGKTQNMFCFFGKIILIPLNNVDQDQTMQTVSICRLCCSQNESFCDPKYFAPKFPPPKKKHMFFVPPPLYQYLPTVLECVSPPWV
jgi:hypothetical protein